jgi:serine/threonine protein phosphatase PrpC
MEDTIRRSLAPKPSAPPSFRLASAAATHAGKVRKVNEDAFLERPDLGLWAVADGVGGAAQGDRASRLVVEALGRVHAPAAAAPFLAEVCDRLKSVNGQLQQEAAAHGGDRLSASTVVALLAFGQHFACAWAGDSRLYLLRDYRLQQISRDHSEVQEMVDRGMLTPEQARTHPHANVVTRAVGAHDNLVIDMVQDRLRRDDVFLLCSDGLTKMLEDREIAALLGGDRPIEIAVEMLLDAALERGASDNVTVVGVQLVAMAETAQSDE